MSEAGEITVTKITQPEYPTENAKLNPLKDHAGNNLPENSEQLAKKIDVLMVFGQGPVKPLMQEKELSEKQKVIWGEFKKDPLRSTEPDFRVVEGEAWTNQLEGKSDEEVNSLISQWQTQGRFGLNRWGRENALAAGLALVSGYSDKVLLSGGKTIPSWAKESLSQARIDNWPSEAKLMADIIKRRFGIVYQKRYGKSIDGVLIFEDASTNTLENVANTLNQNPEIIEDPTKLGLLAANFHIERSERIGALFAPRKDISSAQNSQDILIQRLMEAGNRQTYIKILNWMTAEKNPDLIARNLGEKRFMIGLGTPEYINYWLGYIGLCEDPTILQNTLQRFKTDSKWSEAAKGAFDEAGLSFDDIVEKDLTTVPKDEFSQIAKKLTVLKDQGHRAMPPAQTS